MLAKLFSVSTGCLLFGRSGDKGNCKTEGRWWKWYVHRKLALFHLKYSLDCLKYLLSKFASFCQAGRVYYPNTVPHPLLLMDYSGSARWELKLESCCPVKHFEQISSSSNWRLGSLIWRQGTPDWRLLGAKHWFEAGKHQLEFGATQFRDFNLEGWSSDVMSRGERSVLRPNTNTNDSRVHIFDHIQIIFIKKISLNTNWNNMDFTEYKYYFTEFEYYLVWKITGYKYK